MGEYFDEKALNAEVGGAGAAVSEEADDGLFELGVDALNGEEVPDPNPKADGLPKPDVGVELKADFCSAPAA